jgi:hypothetical protein
VSAPSVPFDARPCSARLADKRAPCPTPVRRRYEELSIPMRVAFPGTVIAILLTPTHTHTHTHTHTLRNKPGPDWSAPCNPATQFVTNPEIIAIDVVADALDLLALLFLARSAEDGGDSSPPSSYALAVKVLVVASLHVGRAAFFLLGNPYMWYAAQVIRCAKLRELGIYIGEMTADLTINVTYLATYKFCLIVYSVPHWVAAVWWLLAQHQLNAPPLASPSWASTWVPLTGNPVFDMARDNSNDGLRYLVSLYMSWSGCTAMGTLHALLPYVTQVTAPCKTNHTHMPHPSLPGVASVTAAYVTPSPTNNRIPHVYHAPGGGCLRDRGRDAPDSLQRLRARHTLPLCVLPT